MDPINVDFTGRGRDDGKKGVADVLIPPEHSGKKIAINIILTLILGAVKTNEKHKCRYAKTSR